ncbi:hypothetical protein [Aeromonas salmonicida]
MEVIDAVNSNLSKNYNKWNCNVFNHDDIKEEYLQSGIHVYKSDSQEIDVYVNGLVGASGIPVEGEFCIIVMSGAVSNRESKDAPFFSGLELAKKCNLPIVAISDPTLSIDKSLNLGWYAGNISQIDLQDRILKIVESIISKHKLKPIFVGGSGGGFAAALLAINSTIQSVAIVWNPQTDITKYHKMHVDKYVRLAFDTDIDKSNNTDEAKAILEKFSIKHKLGTTPSNSSSRILYLQNKSDWHLVKHAKPYLECLMGGERRYGNCFRFSFVDFVVGNWGVDHSAPPVDEIINAIRTVKNNNIDNFMLKFSMGAEDLAWNDFDKKKFVPFVVENNGSLDIELVDKSSSSAPDPELAICLYKDKNIVVQSSYQRSRKFDIDYVDFDSIKILLKDGFGLTSEQLYTNIGGRYISL